MGGSGSQAFDAKEARGILDSMCRVLMVEREHLHQYVELARNKLPEAKAIHHELAKTIETLLDIEKRQRWKAALAKLLRIAKLQDVQIEDLEYMRKALTRLEKDPRIGQSIEDKIHHLWNAIQEEKEELGRAA